MCLHFCFYIWKCIMSLSVLFFFSEFGQMHIKMFIWQSLCLAHSIAMFMHTFIKIFKKFQEIGPVSLLFFFFFFFFFSEFEPRQRLGQSQMAFDNLLGYILSISMCMQSFITIVHSVRSFSLFQNLELSIASIDVKCHFAISWARVGNPSV